MAEYLIARQMHIGAAGLSLALFVLRGFWMLRGSSLLRSAFARIVPHVVDMLLLSSAIWLMLTVEQYPFVNGWLTAKLLAVIAYIVLGSLALKRAPTRRGRLVALGGALAVFGYIVAVALTHDAIPFRHVVPV